MPLLFGASCCDLRQSGAGIHARIGKHGVPREDLFSDSAMCSSILTVNINVSISIKEKVEKQRDIEGVTLYSVGSLASLFTIRAGPLYITRPIINSTKNHFFLHPTLFGRPKQRKRELNGPRLRSTRDQLRCWATVGDCVFFM